ncbi:MAG: helix-turn-helix transcriptional regulator [Flavobacteriales bacterium]|nr:helix-turn-helix transcriptional regulator [Flavobacteriales bacterium]
MIPIHRFENKNPKEIRVVRLDALSHYDTTEMHRHDYFELFVFEKGDGMHWIDFESFPIVSNSVHIVAPGQAHQVKRELDTNGYVILFETSVFESNSLVLNFLYDHLCYDVKELSPTFEFAPEVERQILDITSTIWKDYDSDNPLKHEFILNHVSLLCIHCMRSMKPIQLKQDKNQEVYLKFRRMLINKFREMRKVKDYALELGVSDKQLNEIVSQRTGLSTSAVIYRQLTLEAKRLLNSDWSAKQVAYHLGFEDPAHFSKFFKKQSGLSPSEFQKG